MHICKIDFKKAMEVRHDSKHWYPLGAKQGTVNRCAVKWFFYNYVM